ncbi:MAG: polysaccharide ABC transporter ATP-binding protein [Planctomycetaceae bacterium]
MSASPIIEVRNLGKSYLLGHQTKRNESYVALRDVVGESLKRFGRNALSMLKGQQMVHGDRVEEFWAIDDVSFDIYPGDVVGIIGRNGAGKSTLLKVLSRITEPTRGRVTLRGRVASLLEVGTGFHPELTGRENIFLNGAILGMGRNEIRSKFDEIVDFAEVESFLDTPVKRYSSGMYVRLAFAVAAHLEPEILVVDEVLAVGDIQFQKKCIGKMGSVAESGRTVLFVSHQMGAISDLCSKCIYMKSGRLISEGPTGQIIDQYLGDDIGDSEIVNRARSDAGENALVWFTNVTTRNAAGQIAASFAHDDQISLTVGFDAIASLPRGLAISVCLQDSANRRVFTDYQFVEEINNGNFRQLLVSIPEVLIAPGNYSFIVSLHTFQGEVFDRLERVCEFTVVDNGSKLAMFQGGGTGCVLAACKWDSVAHVPIKVQT